MNDINQINQITFKESILAAIEGWSKKKDEVKTPEATAPEVTTPEAPKENMEADAPAAPSADATDIEARISEIEKAIQALVAKINAMDGEKPVEAAMSAINELKTTVEKMAATSSAKHIGTKEKVALSAEKTGNALVDSIIARRNKNK